MNKSPINIDAIEADRKHQQPPKPLLALPKIGRPMGEFAREAAEILKEANHWFRLGDRIVCVGKTKTDYARDPSGKPIEVSGFVEVDTATAITSLEEVATTGVWAKESKESEWKFLPKSMSREVAAPLLRSRALREALPHVLTVTNVELPYVEDGQLRFTEPGYNPSLGVFMVEEYVSAKKITEDEASEVLRELFGDFPFKPSEKGAPNANEAAALAMYITPYFRLVMGRPTARKPLFKITANSARSGKDAMANQGQIIISGEWAETSFSGENEEVRKTLAALTAAGVPVIHFSNVTQVVRCEALDRFLTNEKPQDRELGKSRTINMPNTALVSMSGNTGFALAGDLPERALQIELRFDGDDPNLRTFHREDIYGWALKPENRARVLGAYRKIVEVWFDAGMPSPPTRFASFPQWHKTVAGAVYTWTGCDLGDTRRKQWKIANPEMAGMNALAEMLTSKPSSEWLTVKDLCRFVAQQQREDPEFFSEYPLYDEYARNFHGIRIRFMNMIRRYAGRPMGSWLIDVSKTPGHTYRDRFCWKLNNGDLVRQ